MRVQATPPTSEFPTYHIESVLDFFQVPPDRLAACLVEFAKWLDVSLAAKECLDTSSKEAGFAIEWRCYRFTWIDDGANDVTLVLPQMAEGDDARASP